MTYLENHQILIPVGPNGLQDLVGALHDRLFLDADGHMRHLIAGGRGGGQGAAGGGVVAIAGQRLIRIRTAALGQRRGHLDSETDSIGLLIVGHRDLRLCSHSAKDCVQESERAMRSLIKWRNQFVSSSADERERERILYFQSNDEETFDQGLTLFLSLCRFPLLDSRYSASSFVAFLTLHFASAPSSLSNAIANVKKLGKLVIDFFHRTIDTGMRSGGGKLQSILAGMFLRRNH